MDLMKNVNPFSLFALLKTKSSFQITANGAVEMDSQSATRIEQGSLKAFKKGTIPPYYFTCPVSIETQTNE